MNVVKFAQNWSKIIRCPKYHVVIVDAYSHRREELIEIKRQGVKFLISVVTFERSESIPPVMTSVFPCCIVMFMQSVVQEKCHKAGHEWLWREYYIDDIIELWKRNIYVSYSESWKINWSNFYLKNKFCILRTHLAPVCTGP